MMCQDCNERPATIVFTQIVNNEKTVLRLCKECAEKRGLKTSIPSSDFPIGDLLAGMAEESGSEEVEEMANRSCAQCGLTYADFKKAGKLGCSECYDTFAQGLKGLLRKIHGSNQHLGKIPDVEKEDVERKKEIRKQKDRMQKAIKEEESEKAAALRDKIHEMEKAWRRKK